MEMLYVIGMSSMILFAIGFSGLVILTNNKES